MNVSAEAGSCATTALWGCLVGGWLSSTVACADPGTTEDRAALFAYVLQATIERTAFSPATAQEIGAGEDITMAEHVRGEMLAYRDEMIRADTDEKLYYVLSRISNTRWDSHVEGVGLVQGGIAPFADDVDREHRHAPIKFKPDYTDRNAMFLFVSDFARDFASYTARQPRLGDRLVAINHTPIDEYLKRYRPYFGRSTRAAVWWAMASALAEKSNRVPSSFYAGEHVTLELQPRRGSSYTLRLPYLEYDRIAWVGHDDRYVGGELSDRPQADPELYRRDLQYEINARRYRGFEHFSSSPAFDIYLSMPRKVVLLKQHRFVPEHVARDLERLLDHARAHDLLEAAVIFDMTRGRGGDFEEYALQRLQPRPFKMIFGNLRISAITPSLAGQLRERAVKSIALRGECRAGRLAREIDGPDCGTYLLEWLDHHLARGIREEQAYSSAVQFKSQWAPPSSDGFIHAHAEHFSGPMVLFTSPHSCSGTDQFAAMFIENFLGMSIGMPQGGCSNSWEWDEILTFPISGKPVVRYSWTVGHSIGPAGQVMEGNPAKPTLLLPLTRDNHREYYDLLMGHALAYIERGRATRKQAPTLWDRITGGRVNCGSCRRAA